MLPSEFLAALFDGAETGNLVLWRGDSKLSTCLTVAGGFDAADGLADECRKIDGANLYFGVGLQAEPVKPAKRGLAAGVVAVPGMWCDLDYAEGATGKASDKKYPPREVAEQALMGMPLPPSLVVNSGGGLHCYWLFNEPLAAVDGAAAMVKGWQALLAERLRKLGGYQLDATADLARVLRPVGSWNHRAGAAVEPADGYADTAGWRRYDPADLRQFLGERPDLLAAIERAEYKVGKLNVADDAPLMIEKMDLLRENCDEFRRVWEHRKDYPSNSEREMALASYAVEALWTDQDIASMLIAHRRRYEPEKLAKLTDRQDYVARTISKARGNANRDLALRDLNGVGEPIGERKPQAPDDDRATPGDGKPTDRQGTLDKLGAVLGVKVDRWIQFGREQPIYSLVLAGGREIRIGSAAAVVESDKAFRQAIYVETGIVMAKVKGKAWGGVCEALASVCEVMDPIEASTSEALRGAIQAFVERKDLYDGKQRDVACLSSASFIDDGRLHINLDAFRKWLGFSGLDKWTRQDVLNTLRILGFADCHVHYTRSGIDTTKRYWRSQAGAFQE